MPLISSDFSSTLHHTFSGIVSSIIYNLHILFSISPLIPLFLSLCIGYWIGKIRIKSFQLGGVSGSLIAAIIISQIGANISNELKNFLFILFIYCVGFQSGPRFFRSLGINSLKEIILSIFLAISGLATVIFLAHNFNLDKGMAAGIAAGGLTQSAIIGTAGSALERLNLPLNTVHQLQGNIAIGYAVTYIFGSIGTIIFCVNILPFFMRKSIHSDAVKAEIHEGKNVNIINNDIPTLPDITGRLYKLTINCPTVQDFENNNKGVTIEKIIRNSYSVKVNRLAKLHIDDTVLLVGQRSAIITAGHTLGEEVSSQDPELNTILSSKDILITNDKLIGKTIKYCLDTINMNTSHGIFITSMKRNGEILSFSDSTIIKNNDILTLMGTEKDIELGSSRIGKPLTHSLKTDIIFHSFGIILGLMIGMMTLSIDSIPLTLGDGSGALLSGLLLGWYQNKHLIFGNMPRGASLLLIDLGLTGFVAATGLQTGQEAIKTISQNGVTIFILGILVTLIPLFLTMLFGRYILRFKNTAILAGALAGSRSANPAFGEVLNKAGNSVPTIPFAITYAMANVLLTLLGPLIIAFC